jgi:hypothetical protein
VYRWFGVVEDLLRSISALFEGFLSSINHEKKIPLRDFDGLTCGYLGPLAS